MTENEKKILERTQFDGADSLYYPVERVAEMFPKNVALRFMGKNFGYAAVSENVTRYARALLDIGLCKGEAVTFALPNIPESVYLLYAASKAGLVASPLHPLATPEVIAAAMRKSGSRVLFMLGDGAQKTANLCDFATVIAINPANSLKIGKFVYAMHSPRPKEHGNIYKLETFLKSPEKIKTKAPLEHRPFHPDTAILLQSGGTTGEPKAIGLSFSAVNNLAAKGLGILGKEKVTDCGMLSVLPVFHGFGLAMGVHAMLCHGGKNVLFPKFHRASAIKEIKRKNVQFVIGVPRLYEALLSHPEFSGDKLRSLSVAFVGGDFVSRTLLKNFDAHIKTNGGNCRLFEGYGLTETVTVCAVNTYEHNRAETVGKPISGIDIEAFDLSQGVKLLPRGEKGELAISGDTLMTEYLGDEKSTQNVFFEFGGKKFVRTGDCGFVDADGFVHFVSRFKRIIKVRGIPVYPMEIEQLACETTGVRGACAVPLPSESGEEKIVLFIESEDDSLKIKLKELIRDKISVYAVPDDIVLVSEFPQTNVSKIDTSKLTEKYLSDKK